MQIQSTLHQLLETALEELNLRREVKIELEHPADLSFGDFSTNVAMQLFKQQTEFHSPRELAQAIVDELKAALDPDFPITKITVAGPGFINFYLDDIVFIDQVGAGSDAALAEIRTENSHTKYLLEHTSPNPNKAMHLGHLRNNVTGMAIANIWQYLGIEVIKDAIDNNRGIAIAKLMWGYLKFARQDGQEKTDLQYWADHQDEWLTPAEAGQTPDKFMDQLYVRAATDFKDHPEVETKVRQMVVDWENHDQLTWRLWEKVLEYVYQGQQKTLKRLSSDWDHVWHEHEHFQSGKDLVEKGLAMGVFKKSQGAVVTDLAKYNLPDTVVIKKDGTALYITQDLALTKLKKDKFHPDHLFWVIGPEQSLALQQMFAVCEQLGIIARDKCTHLSYGYMSLKGQGKMSSRAGNVIYIDDLLDEAKRRVLAKMDQVELPESEKEVIAEKVGVGAVKYSILKVNRTQDMSFDFEESLNFEGNSGPYIEYMYARTQSVLSKVAGVKPELDQLKLELPLVADEQILIRELAQFPEVVVRAGQEMAPHLIANYVYALARDFSLFYTHCSILKAENEEKQQLRLALTAQVATTLQQGLKLLGIEVVEKM